MRAPDCRTEGASLLAFRSRGGAWMGFSVDLEEMRRVHVRVALRRAEARVPEQLLDDAEIGAATAACRPRARRRAPPSRLRRDAPASGCRASVSPRAIRDRRR